MVWYLLWPENTSLASLVSIRLSILFAYILSSLFLITLLKANLSYVSLILHQLSQFQLGHT